MAGSGPRPPDLSPVTWLEAPKHAPVQIVRDGHERAAVYVVDPKGSKPFVAKRRGERPPIIQQLVDQLLETVRLSTGATLELVG